MNKTYTKKRIREAIAYWKKQLKKMNEDNNWKEWRKHCKGCDDIFIYLKEIIKDSSAALGMLEFILDNIKTHEDAEQPQLSEMMAKKKTRECIELAKKLVEKTKDSYCWWNMHASEFDRNMLAENDNLNKND